MASHPIAKCCTVGVKHEGTAVGEIKKIGDGGSNTVRGSSLADLSIVRTYFSYPEDKSTQNAILILTGKSTHLTLLTNISNHSNRRHGRRLHQRSTVLSPSRKLIINPP
jgi:hypothetical protein